MKGGSSSSSPRRVWRSLVVIAVVVGGLSIYAKWGLEEAVAPGGSLAPDAAGLAAAAPAVPGPPGGDELTERLEQPPPWLAVEAVDPEGNPVPQAALTLEGPYGRKLEARGSGRWEDMATGAWTVKAAAEGFFDAEDGVNLRRGKNGEVRITMRPAAVIEGSVKTTFGRPMVAVRLFFLQDGQEIPRLPSEREGLPQATPKQGHFVSPPLPAGRYHIAVRLPGRKLLESEPVQIEEGQRRRAEVYIDRGGWLRVELAGLELPDKGARLLLLQKEKRFLRASSREKEEERLAAREEDPERRAARERGRWRPQDRRPIVPGEPLVFDRVREGEYRFQVDAGASGRFQTEEPILIEGATAKIVRLTLSADPPLEGAGRTVLPIAAEIVEETSLLPHKEEARVVWID